MSETGSTWERVFKGHASEAREVRTWTSTRTHHDDAPLIAHELFTAVLSSGADAVQMTLSTADTRLRITATGPEPLPVRHSHGPGWLIIAGLSQRNGVTEDERGMWAQLGNTEGDG